jgi:glutathione S-transferase
MITITALRRVPPQVQGLVRDLRARWALEEAGLPHRVELFTIDEIKQPAYKKRQPFGQVPALWDGEVTLFESGAIALHVAAKSPSLLPADPEQRARATAWVFAALNSVEIAVVPIIEIDFFHKGESWTDERRPQLLEFLDDRLNQLSEWLGEKEYLEGTFTVGDLMMITVLRMLRDTDAVKASPSWGALGRYVARGEARPAFQKALKAQLDAFEPW